MAETLLKLIEKYEKRIKWIDECIVNNNISSYTKDCYEEMISDLQFLLNNNQ
ncbi:hypothetical protein M5X00_26255 [Paenibacillus alvei]|uniref:hypothetical protein n=1 Tax=Paenibacillus alvei TaxID=44250 RepID=UPI00028A2BFE|nr:hypothetical protein [Paenibacillus alvei]EJW14097.1 hypothetical protein PAV_141p02030 [Paenibacillus alvei DSM 29]MCY9545034.1 hypothetical protein [Paenibacillus alvei]MCY9707754.1 hypothetical protein [Paenibacillus alvei]MCY9757735.1 hypothetical protein [Paenibacillus alvei]MEC0082733.1 hypothetical protein [Paenibacillus alvei]